MKNLCIFSIFTILLFEINIASAVSGYVYEKRIIGHQAVHIVTINPEIYAVDIVKANNGAIGRETVASIAKRSQADIAINGGFFEISACKDGMPSGTLIIHGRQYALKNRLQSLLIIDKGNVSIVSANPSRRIKNDISIVSGIPILISNKKIPIKIFKKNSDFYTQPHARTALGVKPDGKIVIVIAEHKYLKYLKYLIAIISKEMQSFVLQDNAQGLTILELAKLMQALGCKNAINLDGGGSSALWMNNKIINQTYGDKDEENGIQISRPVSDAIIFRALPSNK